jgi:peptidoglycan biosynthesis protein MviN/MurJ (putative lipid II flippase)
MTRRPGAEQTPPVNGPGLQDAAGSLAAALSRYLRALSGLFGLELRETGAHSLVLAALCVGFLVASVFAYLFLVTGATIAATWWLGGKVLAALFVLFGLHVVLAGVLLAVLVRLAKRPLFPGTREALRREMEKIS